MSHDGESWGPWVFLQSSYIVLWVFFWCSKVFKESLGSFETPRGEGEGLFLGWGPLLGAKNVKSFGLYCFACCTMFQTYTLYKYYAPECKNGKLHNFSCYWWSPFLHRVPGPFLDWYGRVNVLCSWGEGLANLKTRLTQSSDSCSFCLKRASSLEPAWKGIKLKANYFAS